MLHLMYSQWTHLQLYYLTHKLHKYLSNMQHYIDQLYYTKISVGSNFIPILNIQFMLRIAYIIIINWLLKYFPIKFIHCMEMMIIHKISSVGIMFEHCLVVWRIATKMNIVLNVFDGIINVNFVIEFECIYFKQFNVNFACFLMFEFEFENVFF